MSASVGGYTNDQFKADVATLKARGKKVVISVGGETGSVAVNDAAEILAYGDAEILSLALEVVDLLVSQADRLAGLTHVVQYPTTLPAAPMTLTD